ncbi:MAG: hypothetical protein CBCREVIR_1172 [Candidatus Burkholderia crenata]|nr:MAG: hypothetical protein CBCREVIR_1172 [Candidatus Burkholderia crenata]
MMFVRQEIKLTPVENARAVGRTPSVRSDGVQPVMLLLDGLYITYNPLQAHNPANDDNHTIARLEFFWFADTRISARNEGPDGGLPGSMPVDFGLPAAAVAQCRRTAGTGLPAPPQRASKPNQGATGGYNPNLIVSSSAPDFAVNPLLQKLQPYPFKKAARAIQGRHAAR